MARRDEERDEEEEIFEQFLAAAAAAIRRYEDALGGGDHAGAAEALEELRGHAWEARDEWLLVEIYYPPEEGPWPWYPVQRADDIATAVKQYLRIIEDELWRKSLPGAGAAVQELRQVIAKAIGSDEIDD